VSVLSADTDPDEARGVLRDDIKAHVGEILKTWTEITATEPWMALPVTHRLDALPIVTAALVDAALTPGRGRVDRYRRFVYAAAEHGETRRKQGFDRELLFTEHYLLREAIWQFLTRTHPDHATDAVLHLDAAVTVGTRASLVGFHREEFTEKGRWPAILEEVVQQSHPESARGA
jgi:hypothetical protein